MKRLIILASFGLNFVVLFSILAFLTVVLASPSIRFKVARALAELPGAFTYVSVRANVVQRDFGAAAEGLERHLRWSLSFKVDQSVLLPTLIWNTEYVFGQLRLDEEFAAVAPFLKRLADSHPGLYRPNVWYATAVLGIDPRAAMPYVEKAQKLIPSDPRAYRVAVQAAVRLDDSEMLSNWCQLYQRAQLSGPRRHDANSLFVSTGLRKLGLEARSPKGSVFFVENHGLHLNEFRTYSFSFPQAIDASTLRLHFGNVPGLALHIRQILLARDGHRREIPWSQWTATPRVGYFTNDGQTLVLGVEDDVVGLRPTIALDYPVDRVDVEAQFSRLALTNRSPCRGNP